MELNSSNLFDVFLVAEKEGTVSARANFVVQPHFTIHEHPRMDVLIVPGGVHFHELEKSNVIEWIAQIDSKTKITASVCTGAFLLAKAGVLQDKSCTTHWEDIPDLRATFPALDVKENAAWVDEERRRRIVAPGLAVNAMVPNVGLMARPDVGERAEGSLRGANHSGENSYFLDWPWSARPGRNMFYWVAGPPAFVVLAMLSMSVFTSKSKG